MSAWISLARASYLSKSNFKEDREAQLRPMPQKSEPGICDELH